MLADLADKVRRAGVVGGSGAPTWLKLSRQAAVVIVNGAECQPLARADREAMTRYPDEIVRGLGLAMRAVRADGGFVAVREDLAQARESLDAALARDAWLRDRVAVVRVPAAYPAGEERQLALLVTGKAAPAGGDPRDSGVLVLGPRSLLGIAEAARDQGATHQLVAVMGAVRKPATFWAPVGLPLERLAAAAGGVTAPGKAVLFPDGPLRGVPAEPADPLVHGVGLLVVLPDDHPAGRKHAVSLDVHMRRGLSACESCEQCTRLCPAHLAGLPVEPHKVMRAVAYGLDGLAETVIAAAHCTGCGLCTAYACPVDLAPSFITLAVKRRLEEGGYFPRLEPVEARPEWRDRQVPLERLLARLDLARYDVPAPLAGTLAADRVLVPTRQPSGLLASPVVRDGHQVKPGQRVADVPDGAPGVPVLASIGGAVRLTPQGVEITG